MSEPENDDGTQPAKPNPEQEAHDLAETLSAAVMEPLLSQIESLEGTPDGGLTPGDRMTILAVAKSNATSYAIIQLLLEHAGMPRAIAQLAKVTARATAAEYMKKLKAEEEAWLRMRAN